MVEAKSTCQRESHFRGRAKKRNKPHPLLFPKEHYEGQVLKSESQVTPMPPSPAHLHISSIVRGKK